jgi:photoactive yellow protein
MPIDTTTRLLAPFLGHLTDEELDAVPYGIIQLDRDGVVRSYNRAEAEDAGYPQRPIGRHFFRDVYPSADIPEFHGIVRNGIARQQLDATFTFTFSCGYLPRRVQVRLYYCVRTASVWVFVARPNGSPLGLAHPDEHPPLRPPPTLGIDLRAPRVA